MKKKKFLWLAVIALTSMPLAASPDDCETKDPPRGQNGWTSAGKQCKTEAASCGTLKLCATSQAHNFATKVTTYTCNCKGAKARLVIADGLPRCGSQVFELSVSPTIGRGFVAAVLGLPEIDGLSSQDLEGMVASVSLELNNGTVIQADSQPLAGTGFDFGIEIPDSFCNDQITLFTFTLGKYVQAEAWE